MGTVFRQILLFGVSVIRRSVLLPCGAAIAPPSADTPAQDDTTADARDRLASPALQDKGPYLSVTYNAAMQPLVEVSVGGQWLKLVFDASSGNTIVFVQEKDACVPKTLVPCYSYKEAEANGTLHVCEENNNLQMECETRSGSKYACEKYLPKFEDAKAHPDALIIDGLEYDQKGVEAKDDMKILMLGTNHLHEWSSMPVRLLVEHMTIPTKHSWISMQLFEGADGILGGSGPSLSCRNQTLWSSLLEELRVSLFALDFQSPPNATVGDAGGEGSRIVFSEADLNPVYTKDMVWSQPKQTGDLINDGMHEFLMYHPQVCGIDMLYNTSSNWLTVIDTSGPCLTLPPFLFDRLMTRIPVTCPFASGEQSSGRLCSPRWDALTPRNVTLPAMYFQLEDAQEPEPPKLYLPLERLVFRNASGAELLCVARDDSDPRKATADMMYSHIALGSLAVSSLYTVVNLDNHTVGLASKGLATESSDDMCTPSVTCLSAMQTYFPPQNLCEDPHCSEYMFMTLDENTKTCKWTRAVPVSFACLLLTLVVLDFASHRLYKQAIEKASEYCQ